jgi:hypothetical protein
LGKSRLALERERRKRAKADDASFTHRDFSLSVQVRSRVSTFTPTRSLSEPSPNKSLIESTCNYSPRKPDPRQATKNSLSVGMC